MEYYNEKRILYLPEQFLSRYVATSFHGQKQQEGKEQLYTFSFQTCTPAITYISPPNLFVFPTANILCTDPLSSSISVLSAILLYTGRLFRLLISQNPTL